MNPDFKKGLKTGAIVYLIGIPLIIITHYVFGIDNGHGPPTSFMLTLVLILLSLFRFVKTLSNILTRNDSARNKGEILTHTIFLCVVATYVFLMYLTYAG